MELEPGVEGLVHVSEMSWTKKNVHPGKIVSTSQEVEVMVLDVDMSKRRISLGLKQCMANPWESFAEQYPVGTELEGEVRNITEFGLFVGLPGDIDGMVHLSDLSWDKAGDEAIRDYKKGDQVKVKVLDVDIDKERISLGIKQLANDPFEKVGAVAKKGDVVTVIVAGIQDNGIDVTVQDGIPGFIRKSELSPRPLRAASRPLRHRRQARRQDHQHRPGLAPGGAVGQGARARRGEEGDGRLRLVRLGRQPGRHSRRGAQPGPEEGREGQKKTTSRVASGRLSGGAGSARAGPFSWQNGLGGGLLRPSRPLSFVI